MTDTADPSESPPVVDLAALVAPIAGDAPTGVDLRADPDPNSIYRRLKAARDAVGTAERALQKDPEAQPPDWSEVGELSIEVLSTVSKDLEVSAWLIESLLRLHGFAGLRDGFRVTRELCEAYWEGLHPAITPDGGVPDRVFALTGLNGEERPGTLIPPINMVPFAAGPGGEPWGLWQWDVAVASAGKAVDESAPTPVTVADIEKAVATGEGGFYRALVADLAAARREYDALAAVLDGLCGSVDSPPGHNIRAALSKYDETIRALARLHLAAAPVADEAGDGAAGGAAGGAGGGGVHKGPIQTREDAFRLLESVSDYFRRTEPHSPLSYSLEQCVRWGRMPLPDLLAELVPDEATRAQLFKLTGIRPPAPPPTPQ